MLGSLSVIATGTSLKFSPENIRSDKKKMFFSGKTFVRLTISASVAEAVPASAVEGRRKSANFYEVLKVRHKASQIEIKTAYRALAKIYHPDVAASAAVETKHPEESVDGRDFIEIHKAYATLSDPAAREIYDLTLRLGSPQRQPLGGTYSASGGYSKKAGFYTTRRWETDQCW